MPLFHLFLYSFPQEIAKDPGFFIDGATRFDIQQGELGKYRTHLAVTASIHSLNVFFLIPTSLLLLYSSLHSYSLYSNLHFQSQALYPLYQNTQA